MTMKRPGFFTTLLIILLITAALTGMLYFFSIWIGSAFVPVDLFAWFQQLGLALPAILADSLNTIFVGNGFAPAQAADATGLILSISLFFVVALLIGIFFYLIAGRRGHKPDLVDGLSAGIIFAVPMIFFSLTVGVSPLPDGWNAALLGLLFLGWGTTLSMAMRRAMVPIVETPPGGTPLVDEPDIQDGDEDSEASPDIPANTPELPEAPEGALFQGVKMDRRAFLVNFSAGTAALAAGSVVVGSALAYEPDIVEKPRPPMPVAGPAFRQAQQELFGDFRRFVILGRGSDDDSGSQVLALGTEYPDRNYVSLWIGDRSPIMIYESLESALQAFGQDGDPAAAFWLDE